MCERIFFQFVFEEKINGPLVRQVKRLNDDILADVAEYRRRLEEILNQRLRELDA